MEPWRIVVLVVAVVLIAVLFMALSRYWSPRVAGISTFEQCAAAGYPVTQTYPRQCIVNNQTYVESATVVVPPAQPPPAVVIPPPVIITPPAQPVTYACVRGGCSGTLCVDEREASNTVTTCEWRPSYACYSSARCERQTNGRCGWTNTPELSRCLSTAQ